MLKSLFSFNFILLIIFIISGCSKNIDNNINVNLPSQIVKIKGKFIVVIPERKLVLKKKFKSDDCESWAVKIDLDSIYKDSLIRLLYEMFEDVKISFSKLPRSEIENDNYIAQIEIVHSDAFSTFETIDNLGKFNINMNSKIIVEGNKTFQSSVFSNNSWEKNIYLSCYLNQGASKASKLAIERLLNQIHDSTYESVFKLKRY
ncbi:MAG: hypothetical protein CFH30_00648 [Alphaproteobacteria bacterium MarineAlpha8_Bin1]|nr:MAG: hypothetical protein CFH30_00648 [Alphaproteobacteria bacterium MarineAlpha8_Bin1]